MLLWNLYFTVYAFSIVIQAVSTQSYFVLSWKARVFGKRKLDQKVEYVIPSPLFKYGRSGFNKQVFQIKVVDKKGNTVDWQNYLNLSICTDMVDTNMYHGSIGEETEDGEIVLFPSNEGKLKFIVKARKNIAKGWRVGIYPRCGKMMSLGQRKCGAGVPGEIYDYKSKNELSFSHRHSSDYTGSDEDFMHSVEWDLSPRPSYWEKKEDMRIKRGSEVCTITANELPPDEYYEERGILDYYLSLDWDHDDK